MTTDKPDLNQLMTDPQYADQKKATYQKAAEMATEEQREMMEAQKDKDLAYHQQFKEHYGTNWTLGIVAEALTHGSLKTTKDVSHITRLLRAYVREEIAQAKAEGRKEGRKEGLYAALNIVGKFGSKKNAFNEIDDEITQLEAECKAEEGV